MLQKAATCTSNEFMSSYLAHCRASGTEPRETGARQAPPPRCCTRLVRPRDLPGVRQQTPTKKIDNTKYRTLNDKARFYCLCYDLAPKIV